VNAYSFLPWLRRGIAVEISGDPGAAQRASVQVKLQISGTPVAGGGPLTAEVARTVQMYGPGDVIGIDPRAIVRTEPHPWVTNFDPNYLAFAEFYDEDFPWRYSPAAADAAKRRLAPWLALVVLTDTEFAEAGTLPGHPLPFIDIPDLTVLPPAGQLGAWAHVHVNGTVTASDSETVSEDMAAVLPRLQAVLGQNPDLASSRLMCPRRLDGDAAYHAFLVPAYETGRLAGLGIDPAGSPGALHPAWTPYPGRAEPERMCYYHRWTFRTAAAGDFEYLVRLLKPRSVDARVGNRDIDVQRPGAGLPGITNPALGGVLRLGGALQVPDAALSDAERAEAQLYENWDSPYPHPFQQALAALVNLSDDYAAAPAALANQGAAAQLAAGTAEDAAHLAADPDPMVTQPLYGRWPSLTSRLLTKRDGTPADPAGNWVHELNLDPRFRVAAGLGTRVVRERQEELMAAAWDQLGDVLEANRRIRAAQLAREVAYVFHSNHLEPLSAAAPGQALAVTAPAHSRVLAAAATVAYQVAGSRIATAPLSPPMRRVTRPGSRLMRRLPFDPKVPPNALLSKINTGEVTAAPPKTPPPGVTTVDQLEQALAPPVPDIRLRGLRRRLRRRAAGGRAGAAIPDPVDGLPLSPDFIVSLPGDEVRPRPGGTDSPEAIRFKAGLTDAYAAFNVADAAGQAPPRDPADLAGIATATVGGLDPDVTIPRRVLGGMALPGRLQPLVADRFVEAMAYPVFDLPMYRPLVALSTELFLPNLNLVPPNSITLVETNQRFVEAYMVGLNHEMARELLWREYPTDQRGSPFRQFWDPRNSLPMPGEDPAALRERLRDIPPLHHWPLRSALGSHDQRQAGGGADDVVLVIRGELLKKYPTAVIYAHRARWQTKPGGGIDPAKERLLEPLTAAEEANPPPAKVRLPLYDAKVDPDIYFFGFDITQDEARGGTGEQPGDDPGWFFVIKERPGEPRFGLDVERTGALQVWNDLAWPDVLPAGQPPGGVTYLRLDAGTPTLTLTQPADPQDQEKADQYAEDKYLTWNAAMSAADAAYILYQAPVLVAVHARVMLTPGGGQ
jgi:hypothetical protein